MNDTMRVTWGPDADKLSADERQAVVDEARERASRDHEEQERVRKVLEGSNYAAVPIDQLASIYRRFLRLVRMGQATIEEWSAMPKAEADIRHAIFDNADFGAVFAGQWLPRDLRDRIREETREEKRP